jgi:hypothetical protein
MALTIPEFLQTKQYSAKALRAALADADLQPGVFGAGDLDVTQRGAGANMSVDVAAGAAWVAATGTRQGNYHTYNDAVVNLAIGNNATGNPRLDQIILRIYDTTDGAAVQDIAALEVLPGTATAGATLDTRSGAAALPNSSLRIADVLVANGAASITNAVIRDRRPWSRGAYRLLNRTAGNITQAATGPIVAFPAAITPRIECSGAPIKLSLRTRVVQSSAGGIVRLYPLIDGAAIDGMTAGNTPFVQNIPVTTDFMFNIDWTTVPAAGSHTLGWGVSVSAGVANFDATAGLPLQVSFEEIVRANAENA